MVRLAPRCNPVLKWDTMKQWQIGGVVLAGLVLAACTTPILVSDADGRACHQNYDKVKQRYGGHFARPCSSDTDKHTGIVETSKADAIAAQPQGLMQAPDSFADNSGIYTRSHFEDGSVYYWMLPYAVMQSGGVLDQNRQIEVRWHSAEKQTVRVYFYHRYTKQDISNIQFNIDGTTHGFVATWPSETIQNAGRKEGSLQYFDVPYQVVKRISQAHQADATLWYADDTEHTVTLVQQGEPSLAAQGLRRFFNAIETR